MVAVMAAEEQAEGCSAARCGNLTISDPFWLTAMENGKQCGSLDFEVTCFNNIPVLRSTMPIAYGLAIIDIAYKKQSLRVVDQDKLEQLQASNSCQVSSMNTSVKLALPFDIDPNNLNLIFYNCTTTVARRDLALVEMGCGSESNMTFVRVGGRYDGSENYKGYYLKGCISTFLPVLGMSGEANASDYKQLISDGFLLTWGGFPPLPLARVAKGCCR